MCLYVVPIVAVWWLTKRSVNFAAALSNCSFVWRAGPYIENHLVLCGSTVVQMIAVMERDGRIINIILYLTKWTHYTFTA